MVDVAKKMFEGQPALVDGLPLYTAPATGAVIRSIIATNTTGIDATVTVAINADGAITPSNTIFSDTVVPANGLLKLSGFEVLDPLGTIRAIQGTAGAITLTISGVEL